MPWRRSGKDPESGTLEQGTQMKSEELQEYKEYKEVIAARDGNKMYPVPDPRARRHS
jgi:hypothetical protein